MGIGINKDDGDLKYTPGLRLPGTSFDDSTAVPDGSSTYAKPPTKPWMAAPPLSDAAKQYTPEEAMAAANPGPSKGYLDSALPGTDSHGSDVPGAPGSDSQLPGVRDPYMQNLYAKNAAASDNMNRILASMPSTTGDGGWSALQSMFDTVLQLSKGVGQKNIATDELARAQQMLQEHERNQAQAQYWGARGESDLQNAAARNKSADAASKKADAYSDKVDNQDAYNQRALELKQQWQNGSLSNKDYQNKLKQAQIQAQINLLNPSAATPPPPPPATGTPPASPTPTPAASSDNTTTGAPPAKKVVAAKPNPNGAGYLVQYDDGTTGVR